mgnify:CR=1 FL=1
MSKLDRVCAAFVAGSVAKSGALTAAGGRLFSYQLLIGDTLNGERVVFDYTAKGGNFRSATTSKHVEAAKHYADKVVTV